MFLILPHQEYECWGGDGGIITTDDDDLANLIAKLRDCGRTSRYSHDVIGFTSRLNLVNEAIGLVQLKRLDDWNERRKKLASRYYRKLRSIPGLILPPMEDEQKIPVFHLYALDVEGMDNLASRLNQVGISTAVHYPIPIHPQPAYGARSGYGVGDFPMSEKLSGRLLSLPLFPSLKVEQVDLVCEEIEKSFN